MHATVLSPTHSQVLESDIMSALQGAVEASRKQSELYRPSSFWSQACQDTIDQLTEFGLNKFRSLSVPLNYFVPTYGLPGNRLTPEVSRQLLDCVAGNSILNASVQQFVSGYSSALADYRVLQAADQTNLRPYFHSFSESDVGNPVEHFEFDTRLFSRSSMNYLLGLCLLKRHLGDEKISTVMEIGGGFGALGEILLKGGDTDIRYIDFDIPPNSSITQYYLSSVFGHEHVKGYIPEEAAEPIHIDQLPAASAFCNWQIEQLQGQVDLFVNFISFQEMEPPIVRNYLSHVDRLQARWVLLRNIREGKQLKTATSVGVEEPIFSEHYQQMLAGYELVESNVQPFGYRTVDGFHSELMLFKRR